MSDFSNSSSCMIDPPPLMAGSDQSCWDMWRKASSSALHRYLRTACATYCSAPHTQRLYSARERERECGAHSAPQRPYTSLLPFWTELPWFGPSGASFIPATHPDRCRVEWRSRPAHLGRRRLGLDGREHGSTLDWHGAKQAGQHQPSNDVADAPSMCVIVLSDKGDRGCGWLSDMLINASGLQPSVIYGRRR